MIPEVRSSPFGGLPFGLVLAGVFPETYSRFTVSSLCPAIMHEYQTSVSTTRRLTPRIRGLWCLPYRGCCFMYPCMYSPDEARALADASAPGSASSPPSLLTEKVVPTMCSAATAELVVNQVERRSEVDHRSQRYRPVVCVTS